MSDFLCLGGQGLKVWLVSDNREVADSNVEVLWNSSTFFPFASLLHLHPCLYTLSAYLYCNSSLCSLHFSVWYRIIVVGEDLLRSGSPTSLFKQGHLEQMDRTVSNQTRDLATSLGSLCQRLITPHLVQPLQMGLCSVALNQAIDAVSTKK